MSITYCYNTCHSWIDWHATMVIERYHTRNGTFVGVCDGKLPKFPQSPVRKYSTHFRMKSAMAVMCFVVEVSDFAPFFGRQQYSSPVRVPRAEGVVLSLTFSEPTLQRRLNHPTELWKGPFPKQQGQRKPTTFNNNNNNNYTNQSHHIHPIDWWCGTSAPPISIA